MKTVFSVAFALLLGLTQWSFVHAESTQPIQVNTVVESIELSAHEGMKVTWESEKDAILGYKVVWSKTDGPTYPTRDQDQVLFVDADHVSVAYLKAFDGEGEYHVRVCEYLEDKCGVYSNEVIVTFEKKEEVDKDKKDHKEEKDEDSAVQVEEIDLSVRGENVVVWHVDGDAAKGVKVVWSQDEEPEYPARDGDKAEYVGADGRAVLTLHAFDGEGVYYVRVCAYTGDGCTAYSNQVEVTLAKKVHKKHFSDVEEKHEHFEAIAYLREKGAVQGYEDLSFRPEKEINRAEFLKIVMEASKHDPSGKNCFKDVANQWHAKYICDAFNKKLVVGYEDGYFRPDQPINFAEAAKIIVNILALQTASTDDETWFEKYVVTMELLSAIPLSVDNFDKKITRGEMSEMIFRIDAGKKDKPSNAYSKILVESVTIRLKDAGAGKVVWEVDGYSKKGFKVVWSRDSEPTYPARKGDQSQYVSDPYATSKHVKAFDGDGKYYVRVCQYLDGSCGTYSNEIAVDLSKEDHKKDSEAGGVRSLTLSQEGDHKVSWKVDGFAAKGFKVVWSKNFGPEYPPRSSDKAEYVGDSNTRSHKLWAFDGDGLYSVRVCEYIGDACGVYSNQVNVELSKDGHKDDHKEDKHDVKDEAAEGAVTAISLSHVEGNKVKWSTEGFAKQGLKVVFSKTPGPTYPPRDSDKAHYIGDGNTDHKFLNAFDGEGTYHVRVCEYLGNSTCGVYSNEITVELSK